MLGTTRLNEHTLHNAPALSWPWSYVAEKGRDLRLDMLRGYCLVVMTIDHVGGASWLYNFTGQGRFFITAAEGFFFISGLVMGMIYMKKIAKEGFGAIVPKILARAWKLYLVVVAFTLFFVGLATFTDFDLWLGRDVRIKDPVELLVGTLTMHFAFHGTEILTMYVLLVLGAIPALYALSKGKWYGVLAVTWALWLANIFYPAQVTIPVQTMFPFMAWQPIFFSGLVIGYHRDDILRIVKPYLTSINIAVVGLALILMALYIANLNGVLADTFPNWDYQGWLFEASNKTTMAWQRVVAMAIFFQAFLALVTWFWVPLKAALGWLVLPLGQAALYVFIMQLVMIDVVYNAPGYKDFPLLNPAYQLMAVGLLLVMVKTKFLFKLIPR